MLSRVAERMYWSGRYLERVENTARLISTFGHLLLDLPRRAGVDWTHVLQIVAAEEAFQRRYDAPTEANVLSFLLADRDNPGSILSSLAFARENVRTSRDIFPTEGWECVNELYLMGREGLDHAIARQTRFDILTECVTRCQQLTGLLAGTMSNGDAANFLRMGSYLERADMSSRVVDVAAASLAGGDLDARAYENTLWMGVLKSLSSYQMYRQHVRRRVTRRDVVTFLLTDRQFPRAVASALASLDACLTTLPRCAAARAVVADLHGQLGSAELAAMSSTQLHGFIDQLQIGFAAVHETIQDTWFLKIAAP